MTTSTQVAQPIEHEALGAIESVTQKLVNWIDTIRTSAKAADVAEQAHYLTPSELARLGTTRDAMIRHAVDQIT